MRPTIKTHEGAGYQGMLSLAVLAVLALMMTSGSAAAQPTTDSLWDFFGDGVGDPYSSVFLNQMFGPLFPSASGANTNSIFATIIAYFNVIVLLIGGMMFFYNVTVGVMQSAHEGKVLGSRWSSLWAPLRVVLAVGMLVPVNSGYNLAQSGVAYVVQGSTKMASAVWAATADAVISDDIPLAAPVTNFSTSVMSSMYEQAACMSTLAAQVQAANPSSSVSYVETDNGVNNGNRYTYQSAINNGSAFVDHGVCGGWSTPRSPTYLDNVIDGITENTVEDANITTAKANQLLTTFRDGHRDIMQTVADDMRGITDSRYAQMMSSDIAPPSIAGEVAGAHTAATESLATLIDDIRTQATSDATGLSRARDSLLTRITGGSGCFSDDGSHNVTGPSTAGLDAADAESATNRAAAVACYGEGWMGAGSWYILMAKINNELSSLTSARSSTSSPSYASGMIWPAEIFRNSGASGSGWFGRVTAADTAGMPGVEQSIEALDKYQDLFESSAMELAALGYQIPTSILNEINNDSETDAAGFWRKVIPEELMLSGTRVMMSVFDPGNGGQDPMIGLISWGHWLISIGATLLGGAAISGFAGIGMGAAVALLPIYSLLLSAGVSLSFILPIMPFLYWVLAISGYFLLICEAVVAVNLWALSHLRMDGEGISGEAGRMGWLMLLSLFMTPTLMVFGFVIGMALFRIVSDLISAGMFYAVSGIIGTNPVVWLFGTLGYTILIVTSYGILLERSFSLISEFPNRIMRWMGSSVEIGGGEGGIKVAAAAAAVGVNHAGNQIEKGMGTQGADKDGRPDGFKKGFGVAGKARLAGERYRSGGMTKS
jgi:conjugal transfer/type IV secretion protein DotA/TraY